MWWYCCSSDCDSWFSNMEVLNPCAEFFRRKHNNVFTFSIISQDWAGAGRWNSSLWETSSYLSYIVNTMEFARNSPLKNIPALVQIMTYHDQVTSHYLHQWHIHKYASHGLKELTHLGLNKIATILHITPSNVFCLKEGCILVNWRLFLSLNCDKKSSLIWEWFHTK